MRRRLWQDRTVEFTRVAPGHQLATLYGKGVGIEQRGRRLALRLNIERSLDGPGWAVTPAFSVGGVEQLAEAVQASAALIKRQMIHGPHPTLAAAKDAIKEASRAAYCRAAVPRMRERADKLRAEAGDLDARADQYVSLYGEGES